MFQTLTDIEQKIFNLTDPKWHRDFRRYLTMGDTTPAFEEYLMQIPEGSALDQAIDEYVDVLLNALVKL